MSGIDRETAVELLKIVVSEAIFASPVLVPVLLHHAVGAMPAPVAEHRWPLGQAAMPALQQPEAEPAQA